MKRILTNLIIGITANLLSAIPGSLLILVVIVLGKLGHFPNALLCIGQQLVMVYILQVIIAVITAVSTKLFGDPLYPEQVSIDVVVPAIAASVVHFIIVFACLYIDNMHGLANSVLLIVYSFLLLPASLITVLISNDFWTSTN